MKMKTENEIYSRLAKEFGYSVASQIVCTFMNVASLELVREELFVNYVTNGTEDKKLVSAAKTYAEMLAIGVRHKIVETITGLQFPTHKLMTDEVNELAKARTKAAEFAATRERLSAHSEVFITLMTKVDVQDAVISDSANSLKALDTAKVAKDSPAYKFICEAKEKAERERKALAKEINNQVALFTEFNLTDLIPKDTEKYISE